MITLAKFLCILGIRHDWEETDGHRKRRCMLCDKRQKKVGVNKPYQKWVDLS